jgi:hypothetical protein
MEGRFKLSRAGSFIGALLAVRPGKMTLCAWGA